MTVKVLAPELSADHEVLRMFRDEGELALQMHHPGCVETIEVGSSAGLEFISMEHIFGHTFSVLIATAAASGGLLPTSMVALTLAAACDALHYAHELRDQDGRPYGLVHRDVCPHNLMLDFDGRVKLLDFGVARADTGRTRTETGIVKGRYSYMAPEHITGGTTDRRSDIYSMGVVLFEALAGERLHDDSNPAELAIAVTEGRLPDLASRRPDVDPALEAIYLKATATRAEDRFQTAAELADALRQVGRTGRAAGPREPSAAIAGQMERWLGEGLAARRAALGEAVRPGRDLPRVLGALFASPLRDQELAGLPAFVAPRADSLPAVPRPPVGADLRADELLRTEVASAAATSAALDVSPRTPTPMFDDPSSGALPGARTVALPPRPEPGLRAADGPTTRAPLAAPPPPASDDEGTTTVVPGDPALDGTARGPHERLGLDAVAMPPAAAFEDEATDFEPDEDDPPTALETAIPIDDADRTGPMLTARTPAGLPVVPARRLDTTDTAPARPEAGYSRRFLVVAVALAALAGLGGGLAAWWLLGT